MWQSMSRSPVNLFHLRGNFFASTSVQLQLLWMFWPMSTPDRKQVCGYNIWSQERTILPSILFIFLSFSSVLDNSSTLLEQSWAGYVNHPGSCSYKQQGPRCQYCSTRLAAQGCRSASTWLVMVRTDTSSAGTWFVPFSAVSIELKPKFQPVHNL